MKITMEHQTLNIADGLYMVMERCLGEIKSYGPMSLDEAEELISRRRWQLQDAAESLLKEARRFAKEDAE